MLEDTNSLSNKYINNEQVINDIIHFASTKEVSVKILNENITDSTVINNVTVSLSKSYEFQELIEKEKTLTELFSHLPENEVAKRLEISTKINHQKNVIRKYVQDILTLAEQFNRIEINTDRLQRAKELFDKGRFGEAKTILEMEIEQMKDEQTHLLVKRGEYETDTLPKLKNNSEEFFILALLTQFDYANKNWFANTCEHFELSIKSYPTKYNIFQYAYFLGKHNHIVKAEYHYNKLLQTFSSELTSVNIAVILNNLAGLNAKQNEFAKAKEKYQKSLKIRRDLAKGNPSVYILFVADTLVNLGGLHTSENEYGKALESYNEALEIYQNAAKHNSTVYPYVAITLNNLANLHIDRNEYNIALQELEEALKIYRSLVKCNPNNYEYLGFLANTLNNLSVCYRKQNDYKKALVLIKESLEISQKLAKENPLIYLSELAMRLSNLANIYKDQNDFQMSFEKDEEALKILRNLAKDNPKIYEADIAHLLQNLAILHHDRNEFDKAVEKYEESLKIRRKLAEKNSSVYLSEVAKILKSLGILHRNQNEYRKALAEYEESLKIRRALAKETPSVYLPEVAEMLNLLGVWHRNQNELEKGLIYFDEAVEIYRNLSRQNPLVYLSELAVTLNNKANLYLEKKDYKKTLQLYEEALEINKTLVKDKPKYIPNLTTNLINLGIYYQKCKYNRDKSIEYSLESLSLLIPIIEKIPYTQKYYMKALQILYGWGLTDEQIQNLIDKYISENN